MTLKLKLRDVVVVVACVLAGACATKRAQVSAVGVSSASSVRTCGGCHAAAEDGWKKSMHHASFSDRDFQHALADDPLPFCVDCHAPRRRELGDTAAAARLGVDCVSCHPNASTHEREALAGSPKVVTTVKCEGCHELPNPMAATMLQTTASEHEASAYAGVACVECHMTTRPDGRRDHEMNVTRNVGLLSNALAYTVRNEAGGVVVELRSKGVGHRFPTGDLFRALLVHSWIEGADGRIVSETKTSLHRDWDAVRRAPGVPAMSDSRLGDTPLPITLAIPAGEVVKGALLHIQVDYARGATARGENFTMFSSVRIADWTTEL